VEELHFDSGQGKAIPIFIKVCGLTLGLSQFAGLWEPEDFSHGYNGRGVKLTSKFRG